MKQLVDAKIDPNSKESESYELKLKKRERQVRKFVYERYYEMRDDPRRREAEEDWEMADKEFRQYVPEIDPDDWRSYLNLPDAFSAIQTQMQETIERKSRPILAAVEESDEPIADFSTAVMNYNMNCTGYDYQYFLAKLAAAIRGTSFLMDYWRKDVRVVKDPKLGDDGEITYQDREVVDYDDDYTEWVPNEYIYVDEKAKHIDEAVDTARREILNIDEFHRIYDNKVGFKNGEYVVMGGETTTRSFFQMPKDMTEHDVEVLHYYNRSIDAYWVVANNVPIRMDPIPYKHKELPLGVVYQYRIPGFFWGMGVPKVIFYLTEERKALRRLNLDRQKLNIAGAFLHNNSFDIDDEDMTLAPGRFISVDTQGQPINNALQRVDFGDVSASYFRTEEILLEDMRRGHGVDDRIVVSNQATTATQAAIVKESALKRLNMLSTLDEMDNVRRIGKLKWSNIQFFYPVPVMERITENNEERDKKVQRRITVEGKKFSIVEGDGGPQLKMEEVRGKSALRLDNKFGKYLQKNYDIEVSAEAYTPPSKAIQQTKAQELFSLFLSNPATLAKMEINGAMNEMLRLNNMNADKWLRPEAAPVHEMEMLADAENMIMAAGQPLAPTEGATEEHTMVHLNYTKTAEFQELSDEIQAIISDHIMGETQGNPATAGLAGAGGGLGGPPGAPGPSTGFAPNTTEPQAQVADLQPTNFANPE